MKRFLKKQLPATLLALVMMVSLLPIAGAASSDIKKSVDAGEEITFTRTEFRSLFNAEESKDTFYYLEFTDCDDLDDYGFFSAYDYTDDEVSLDEDDLENARFYYDSSDVTKKNRYTLSSLTFVADDDAEDASLYLDYTLVGEDDTEVYGTLEIEISGGSGDDIIYTVKANSKVEFSADDFCEYFEDNISSSQYSLRYVVFDKPSSSTLSNGTLYYNYGKSSSVEFTRTTFANATFYYDDSDYGDYSLDKLSFVTDKSFSDDVSLSFKAYYNESHYVEGTVYLDYSKAGSSSSTDISDADLEYEVDEGNEVSFNRTDFRDLFKEEFGTNDSIYCVEFTDSTNLDDCGYFYAYGYDDDKVTLDEDDMEDSTFYYYGSDFDEDDNDAYYLDDLTFVADDDTDGEWVSLEFTIYGEDDSELDGLLVILIGDVDSTSAAADIKYEGAPEEETAFDPDDFNDFFQETYSNYTLKYVIFTNSENLNSYNGEMVVNYGRSSEKAFTSTTLKKAYFYYDEDKIPDDNDNCYALEDLSFVGDEYFDTEVTLEFRAYCSTSRYVDGTVVITPEGSSASTSGKTSGDIIYQTATNTSVQIKAADFVRFLQSQYPTSTLQYVKINGVPAAGGLYYNYYNASPYGTAARVKLTASTCDDQNFHLSPSDTSQYALTELTYVPSGTNYCAAISFTAYGSGSRSVNGTILISVSPKTVPEVYGVITRGTAVSLPAPSIAAAVLSGTGSNLYSIQLLDLPDSSTGTVYVGSGTTRKATTSDLYGYSSGTWQISQLRFVPTSSFTGSMEIPYAACDANGNPIAVGKFCLGVVNSAKKFSDVTSSTWCYKYVTELSDAGVISGYANGTFKPDSTISYGAALKLIMLAAGYDEQAPVNSNVFSGYLAKARADGLITRSNVDLTKSITRLQVAQLAAGALKLDLDNLSSVKPFNDTADLYVQALNAAGIVEGYFSNGVSSYRPNNTLTRGQVSAIVWRMQNYVN